MRPTALIADDEPLLREALRRQLAQAWPELDVIAVQFIWAARRSAQAAGLEFALSGVVPESILSALDDTGLRHFLVPFDAQLIKGAADC